MNRRQFFTRVSVGLVATCVVAKIPTQWLPEPVQRCAALDFMRKAVNDYTDRHGIENYPSKIVITHDLMDAMDSEFTDRQRFCVIDVMGVPRPLFKGLAVYGVPERGWRVVEIS